MPDTQPTGMLHPDWTVTPWKECAEHWARVRANIKPTVWSPQPATVYMDVGDDVNRDMQRFKQLRFEALQKRRSTLKPWSPPVVSERENGR